MFSSITSGVVYGVRCYLIHVETDLADGLPGISIVGSVSTSVREAADRIRVAIKNSGLRLPPARITINLSPADIPKRSMGLDLPMAAGVLVCMGILKSDQMENIFIAGELSLDGEIVPVRGVLPMLTQAAKSGMKTCIVPKQNEQEGAVVGTLYPDMKVVGVQTLQELITYCNAKEGERDAFLAPATVDLDAMFASDNQHFESDFAEVHGQENVKRVLAIAAAGFHHVLMVGPPGAGKTMMAKCLPSILPPMTRKESLEVSEIYSVAGLLKEGKPLVTQRPFWAPHHTITQQSLTGGGRDPAPGLISLSHRSVLFLDELPEFDKTVINTLRQPLEDHVAVISRMNGSCTYPARFLMVCGANPCPCGLYPSQKCKCTQAEVMRYQRRISGPILDRIDLTTDVQRLPVGALMSHTKEVDSATIRQKVMAARERQLQRFAGMDISYNGDMRAADVEKFCELGRTEQRFVKEMFAGLDLSARAYHKILRVSRTIADLDDCDRITEDHLAEAAGYRAVERS